jgi:hypothetical protein
MNMETFDGNIEEQQEPAKNERLSETEAHDFAQKMIEYLKLDENGDRMPNSFEQYLLDNGEFLDFKPKKEDYDEALLAVEKMIQQTKDRELAEKIRRRSAEILTRLSEQLYLSEKINTTLPSDEGYEPLSQVAKKLKKKS